MLRIHTSPSTAPPTADVIAVMWRQAQHQRNARKKLTPCMNSFRRLASTLPLVCLHVTTMHGSDYLERCHRRNPRIDLPTISCHNTAPSLRPRGCARCQIWRRAAKPKYKNRAGQLGWRRTKFSGLLWTLDARSRRRHRAEAGCCTTAQALVLCFEHPP